MEDEATPITFIVPAERRVLSLGVLKVGSSAKVELLSNVPMYGPHLCMRGHADVEIRFQRSIVCVTVVRTDGDCSHETCESALLRDAICENGIACEATAAGQSARAVFGTTTNYALRLTL